MAAPGCWLVVTSNLPAFRHPHRGLLVNLGCCCSLAACTTRRLARAAPAVWTANVRSSPLQPNRARTLDREDVLGIRQRAGAQAQTTAADAVGEIVPQPLQVQ